MFFLKWLPVLFCINSALAASSDAHHEASVMDLKWPAVNFILFFGFLLWKLRKPIKDMFDAHADLVVDHHQRASEKHKEAELKLDMFKEKLEKFEAEADSMMAKAKDEIDSFEQTKKEQTEELVARLKSDAESKIDYEKELLLNEMNAELVDIVVGKAKDTIASDATTQKKVTDNLLSGLQ